MVLAWDRNSVLTLVLLLQFWGGVMYERESDIGF